MHLCVVFVHSHPVCPCPHTHHTPTHLTHTAWHPGSGHLDQQPCGREQQLPATPAARLDRPDHSLGQPQRIVFVAGVAVSCCLLTERAPGCVLFQTSKRLTSTVQHILTLLLCRFPPFPSVFQCIALCLQALGGSIDSNPCHACSMTGTCTTDVACTT